MTIGLTWIAGLEAEMRARLAEKDRQIAALRDELATAQAAYLQFTQASDAKLAKATAALEEIVTMSKDGAFAEVARKGLTK